ncbi:MAG: glycosyltransferase [Phycisphaeraceae bacterium]|nr:glycosyltransferase [Phycisphaeraceae bacterium]
MEAGSPFPRVALAHDWLVGYRGGEGVLDCHARLIAHESPDRPRPIVYTMFDNGRPITSAIDSLPRRVSFLNSVPGSDRARRWLLPFYHAGVATLSRTLAHDHARSPIDVVLSSSSAAIHALRVPKGVRHICVCFTPPRYLWELGDQYNQGLMGLGLRGCSPFLRRLDYRAAQHVTRYIAISTVTQERIRNFYGLDSEIVFPPVRTLYFTPEGDDALSAEDESKLGSLPSGFLFYIGALEPYKKAELAITAAERLKRPLVVAGSGSQLGRLKESTADSKYVTLLGRVSDPLLRALYRRADALLFPQLEDFGIVALEAQACGTPVVAFGVGGSRDTVINGQTGVVFDEQTVESLADAIGHCPSKGSAARACRVNAERFSEEANFDQMRRVIRESVDAAPSS